MNTVQYAPRQHNLTRDEAIMYCFLCTYDGYKNWRLPTRHELAEHTGITLSVELYRRYHANIDVRRSYDAVILIPVRDV